MAKRFLNIVDNTTQCTLNIADLYLSDDFTVTKTGDCHELGVNIISGGTAVLSDGTNALPSLTNTGDLNTGLYFPAADTVGITTGGTLRLDVSTTAVTSTLPVVLPVGAVGAPSLTFTGQTTDGFYSVSANQLGTAVNGVLVGGWNTTGLYTDVISEQTATTGVTIDGTLLKDGGVTASGTVSMTEAQAAVGTSGVNSVLSTTAQFTALTLSTAADVATLATPTVDGIRKLLYVVAENAAGDGLVITVTDGLGFTTITYTAAGTNVGDCVELISKNSKWIVVSARGNVVIA